MQEKPVMPEPEMLRPTRFAGPVVAPLAPPAGPTPGPLEGSEPCESSGFRPRWIGQFLGREVLRVCPEASKSDPCAGCSLRVFCRCAQADFAAAERVERRVWIVLASCGAAVLLYALF